MSSSNPPTGPLAAPSVSLKHILLSEILAVTSVMRKNSRWAMSTHPFGNTGDSALATSLGLRRTRPYTSPFVSDKGSNEQELMRGFQELRRLVKDIEGAPRRVILRYRAYVANYHARYSIATLDYSSGPLFCNHTITIIHRADHLCCSQRAP